MPFSCCEYATPVARVLQRIPTPATVLDLGIGLGYWGFLTRYYHDLYTLRLKRQDWQVNIVGVEGHEGYRSPSWDVYNNVVIGDAPTYLKASIHRYDLVFAVEILEHLEKEAGIDFLKELAKHGKHVIVSYSNLEQGAWHGNELERHRSKWCLAEIRHHFQSSETLYDDSVNAILSCYS